MQAYDVWKLRRDDVMDEGVQTDAKRFEAWAWILNRV